MFFVAILLYAGFGHAQICMQDSVCLNKHVCFLMLFFPQELALRVSDDLDGSRAHVLLDNRN